MYQKEWNSFTEFGAIERYLEKRGSEVVAIEYFDTNIVATAPLAGTYLGHALGEQDRGGWFLGNVQLVSKIGGVIVLTNENRLRLQLVTDLRGIFQYNLIYNFGVNLHMSLAGNGEYFGDHRFYGAGFNRIELNTYGCGAATYEVGIQFNGYLFRLKYPAV